jgi:crotonobetainyl-CoA:carnitine CoA-transferase CaiB-like acyl-CoA transferase
LSGPLEGIRVIEFAQLVLGPQCAAMLHDMGAEVVKVEPRGRGDHARSIPISSEDARAPYYIAHNRGKRSVTLDFSLPQGLEVVQRLVERSDVMIASLRPGSMTALGLSYDDCAAINPRLIYANGSAYGPEGPDAHRGGTDPYGQAVGGLVAATGSPEMPTVAGAVIADSMAGQVMCSGILAALYWREQSGRGQRIDSSLYGAQIWAQSAELTYKLVGDVQYDRIARGHPSLSRLSVYRVFATADGFVFGFGGGLPQLFRALELNQLAEDERFADPRSAALHMDELVESLKPVLLTRTSEQWAGRFDAEGIAFQIVQDYSAVAEDPQALANGYVADLEQSDGTTARLVGNPLGMSETPPTPGVRPPELGEHTEEVLLELGYDWDAIGELRGAGAI